MKEDIVTRLRHFEKWRLYGGEPCDGSDFKEAADEIERLRAALKPFANFDASHDDGDLAVTIQLNVRPHDRMELPLSAFHAARAALTK